MRASTNSVPFLSQAYFIGQGFDITSVATIPDSLIVPILDPDKAGTREFEILGKKYLIPDYVQGAENTTADVIEATVETRDDFQNSIASSASVEVGYGAFSGQMEASYGHEFASSSSYSYSYHNFYSRLASLMLLESEAQKALSDDFISRYEALPDNPRGNLEDFETFFHDFGMYVISVVNLGAALEYYVAVEKSSQLSTTDIAAQVKVQYKSLFVTGGISAELKTSQQWKQYASSNSVSISARGGDPTTLAQLTSVDPKNPSSGSVTAYNNWVDSITDAPAVADFSLLGIWRIIPDPTKSQAVREAFTMLNSKLRPRLVIETSAVQGRPPTITLGVVIRPEHPPSYPIGFQLVMFDRDDLSISGVRLNKYYGVAANSWYEAYEHMYDDMAEDLEEGGFVSTHNVLVLASYGMSTNAPPNASLYPLLRSFGGGPQVQKWVEWADLGSSMYRWPGSYILTGIGALGPETGVEILQYGDDTIQQEVLCYRNRGGKYYTLSLGKQGVVGQPDTAPGGVRRAYRTSGKNQSYLRAIE